MNTKKITKNKLSKRKVGRPSRRTDMLLSQPILSKIKEMAKLNFSQNKIIKHLGINENTFHKAKAKHLAVIQGAMDSGRIEGIEFAVSKLYEQIEKGNVAAIKFYLERMDKYRWGALEQKVTAEIMTQDTKITFVLQPVAPTCIDDED